MLEQRRLLIEGDDAAVYSIGHSNHSLERLVELLKEHGVEVIADVRSSPWSRYVPWFGRSVLEKELPRHGIRYVFMGDQLGGKPEGDEFADAGDRGELYRRIAETPAFRAGVDRLERGAAQFRVAMLCSEENPAVCHRHRLVTPALQERGIAVKHIRGDGSVEPAPEPNERMAQPAPKAQQLSLF